MHAAGALRRAQLDLLHQQGQVDAKVSCCFHFSSGDRVLEAVDGTSQVWAAELEQIRHNFILQVSLRLLGMSRTCFLTR